MTKMQPSLDSVAHLDGSMKALAEMKGSMDRLAAMQTDFDSMAKGMRDLAAMRPAMEQMATLGPQLTAVARLGSMGDVAGLKPTLQAVADLKQPMDNLTKLADPMNRVSRLEGRSKNRGAGHADEHAGGAGRFAGTRPVGPHRGGASLVCRCGCWRRQWARRQASTSAIGCRATKEPHRRGIVSTRGGVRWKFCLRLAQDEVAMT